VKVIGNFHEDLIQSVQGVFGFQVVSCRLLVVFEVVCELCRHFRLKSSKSAMA
jgi:hypothetical protein